MLKQIVIQYLRGEKRKKERKKSHTFNIKLLSLTLHSEDRNVLVFFFHVPVYCVDHFSNLVPVSCRLEKNGKTFLNSTVIKRLFVIYTWAASYYLKNTSVLLRV